MAKKLLLDKIHIEGIRGYDVYRRQGGYKSVEKAFTMQPGAIVDEVKRSGLRGRGGAGFPEHRQGRIHCCRTIRRRRIAQTRQDGRLLPLAGGILRLSSRDSKLWLRVIFHGRRIGKVFGEQRRLGARHGAELGRTGHGFREKLIDDNAAEGGLCVYFRSERLDGRLRHSGI